MTHNIRAAAAAADATANELIDQYDVDVVALTIAILHELRRQERAYYDRLNDEANRNIVIGPEERSPA